MEQRLHNGLRTESAVRGSDRSKGLALGLAGGAAATIVIDLITAGVLPLV